MLTPLFSRQRQQEAVPVLTVHAILKGGRFVETGTDLPKEETPDWLKPSGRRNEGMERLEKLDGHNQGGQGFKTETTLRRRRTRYRTFFRPR